MPLSWPGSDKRSEEAAKDPNEFEFRDGTRTVAPYLAALMSGMDTKRLTFEDAIKAVNAGLLTDHLGRNFDRMVQGHMSRWGR